MFQLIDVFFAFITIALLVLVGRFVRQRVKLLRDLYLPSSIVAGVIALLLGPQALGAIVSAVAGSEAPFAQGLFPETIRNVWSQSPSVFINVVFATLFIGESIPSPRDIWRKASPQVAFGQTLAWGQYVVGLLLAILILTPIFGMSPIAASLIEVAFEGGHGTAAGMAETFNNLGFTAGPDLALGLATVGIVSGIIAGTMLADWARKTGRIQVVRSEDPEAGSFDSHDRPTETQTIRVARARLMRDLLIDPLSLNLSFVGLAIAIGWLILQALIYLESITWGRAGVELFSYVPLFPIALIGGLIVQLLVERTGRSYLISRPLIERIGGVALDVTIVTALASISLAVLGSNLGPFLILSVAGIAWNVLAFIYLGPRMLPTFWFERGIGDLGQSMGVTATGLVLMRMVDPDNRSGAFESFAYKQLLFEPIVGGGLFTAAAPLLIAQFGPVPVLLLTTGILAFWLVFGMYNFKRIAKSSQVV
jgi:ESS family glutamate:Na+ symporter